jgi:predicted dienelactone hydrolase
MSQLEYPIFQKDKIVFKRLITLILLCLFLPVASAQAAPRPDAPKYAKRGVFAVGTREFKIDDKVRPLVGTIWYPALKAADQKEETTYTAGLLSDKGFAIRDAQPDTKNGPYPLIIFSHGYMGLRLQSLWYTEHLASYGFVVMAVDHPGSTLFDYQNADPVDNWALRPSDALREINYAEMVFNPKGGSLEGVIDMNSIAISGHSLGGYTALAVAGAQLNFDDLRAWCATKPDPALKPELACGDYLKNENAIAKRRGLGDAPKGLWPATTDKRIKAMVALAPANAPVFGKSGLAAIQVPTMIIVGSKDQTTIPERDAYPAYEGISSTRKALAVLENGGHYLFVQSCPPIAITLNLYWGCSDQVWDMDRAHDLINHMATAFLLETLKGDKDAAAALKQIDFTGVKYTSAG